MTDQTSKKSFRAFLGIPLSDEVRYTISKIIAELSEKKDFNKVKWINTENLHITLTFLGNISTKISQEMIELIQERLKDISSFTIKFSSLMALPSEQSPRVLTLFSDSADQLISLESIIKQIVADCGINVEKRPYIPHITIGRIKSKCHLLNLEKIQLPEIKTKITHITLFRSDLSSEGPTYTEIATILLK